MSHSPSFLLLLMLAAALLPFVAVMLTSFVKMAVVLSIVRTAVGTPQVPPSSVVTGLALVLTLAVMAPVAGQVGERLAGAEEVIERGDWRGLQELATRAAEPLDAFLRAHTDPWQLESMGRALGEQHEPPSWKVLVPAYVVTQLHQAFRMGFGIFLPFLVLDLLVSSILLSLGMHMLSPTTVSLPLKLLLFVFADGWTLIGTSLVGSYQ